MGNYGEPSTLMNGALRTGTSNDRRVSHDEPQIGVSAQPKVYNRKVVARLVIDISEAEATRDFGSLLVRVRAGAEVIIKDGSQPIAVVRPAELPVRRLSESLQLAREHGSTATLDENFAKDVEAAVEAHRESLNPPAWD